MSDFGDRLRDERKRLGMNLVDFAELGGVKKNAQMNYESGERAPDSNYLCSLLRSGVDIIYVLTGQRDTLNLTIDEKGVIAGFRSLDARGKAGVIALISGINPVQKSPKNVFHGNVGQIIEGDVQQNPVFSFGKDSDE